MNVNVLKKEDIIDVYSFGLFLNYTYSIIRHILLKTMDYLVQILYLVHIIIL
jgi:hypothetical protein